MSNEEIALECVKRTDERYQEIRNRHYVENNGTHGQQLHFIIHYNGKVVGIISGASSVYGVGARDTFFGIPKDKEIKQSYYLPAIINNTVFRLEFHEKNLATRVLALWRKVCAQLWEDIYGVKVIGFETFVVENDTRKGALYKADNWTYLGETKGNTKVHNKGGLTAQHTRAETDKKLIYAKWTTKRPVKPTSKYESSWRQATDAEKAKAKTIVEYKRKLDGLLISDIDDVPNKLDIAPKELFDLFAD